MQKGSGFPSLGRYIWSEEPINLTSVHFDYNVHYACDMSDYTITSASINAVVNASVHANAGVQAGLMFQEIAASYMLI